jgi:hypothetical protein
MAQPAHDPRQPFVAAGQNAINVRVLEAHPRRDQPRRPVRLEQLLEPRRPPERGQFVQETAPLVSCRR